jgi:putative ABC transport system permease protein
MFIEKDSKVRGCDFKKLPSDTSRLSCAVKNTLASQCSRTREIGLRVAVGATPGTILSLVLRDGLTYAGLGVAAGVGLALGLTRLMSSLLFGVQATDTLTFATVTGVVALVSAAASLLPALRAMRVDPMVALRNE